MLMYVFNANFSQIDSLCSMLQHFSQSTCPEVYDALDDFHQALAATPAELIVIAIGSEQHHNQGIHAIHTAQKLQQAPILCVGGATSSAVALQYIRAGADDYVESGDFSLLAHSTLHLLEQSRESRTQSSIAIALANAGRQWRATFDAMQDAICITDEKGIILRANKAFQLFIDMPWTDFIDRTFAGVTHGKIPPTDTETPPDTGRNEQYFRYHGLWYRMTIAATPNPENQQPEYIRILSDITYSRLLEDALQTAEDRNTRFFDQLPLGALYLDTAGQVTACNPAAERIIGVEHHDIIGSKIDDLPCTACDATMQPYRFDTPEYRQLFEQGIGVPDTTIGFSNLRSDRFTWIKLTGFPLQQARSHSNPVTVIIFEDVTAEFSARGELESAITRLQQTQQQLQRHSDWIRVMNRFTREAAEQHSLDALLQLACAYIDRQFQHCCSSMVFQEPDGDRFTVQAAGHRGQEIAARAGFYPRNSFSADSMPQLLKGDRTPGILQTSAIDEAATPEMHQVMAQIRESGIVQIVRIPFQLTNERMGLLLLGYAHNSELSHDAWHFLYNLTEYLAVLLRNWSLYTELEQAYTRMSRTLEHLDQQRRMEALGQLASGIAHDINNALVPISLYSNALLEENPDPDSKMHRYLGAIRNAASDIEHVTARMRSFYQHESEGETSDIGIDDLFAEVIDLTRPLWRSTARRQHIQVDITTEIADDLPPLKINRSDLRESLTNLIINSMDAMPTGGSILLRARTTRDRVAVEVQDTGIGMDEATRQRCLEPFFTTKGVEGSGLGLPGVFGMVQRYGGTVSIESSPGRGTTISLLFPSTLTPDTPPVTAEAPPLDHPLQILLVDDDDRVLPVIREMLQLDGHTVDSCRTVEQAYKLFRQRQKNRTPYDVVCTDYAMGDASGPGFAAGIKKLAPDTPVILLTGWGVLMSAADIPADVDQLLNKPPSIGDLRFALAKSVQRG
ncbi:ATP-binding protein [Spirochaeta africana]|uniref:histidine kinase n=1 Tax=Spirochaeta africana (strain ATCC 700263 / DSM 8902 / Z-7692) TaxID=889378 RepID=H9ULE4_SPIAZ|nr:ATP-binding protein [Spirochaeta africana]AFG38337.1 PAS domain S-box [Spirochaeta africana DSM 8902]